MIKSVKIALLTATLVFSSFVSDNPAYRVFDSKGKGSSYSKMLNEASEADIVFIGELHNNSIAHWIELEVTGDLFETRGSDLVLGAEMFERDDQLAINEYFSGAYATDKFEPEVKLWKNYKTDYKPLLEFAREHNLGFIATNIPRRYASMVSKEALKPLTLADDAKRYIAPFLHLMILN
ncbi:MAG: ChaN family lipoprotein [Bacteroidales bacterium]